MVISRTILAALLIIIGVMVESVWTATKELKGEVSHLVERIDSMPQSVILQSSIMRIGKPRVPAVRHFYKRPQTIIDPLCKP